jgi:adenylylsulfate kinase
MKKDIAWQKHPIDKSIRSVMKNQRPYLLWFTGLSGSGKSSIAGVVESKLAERLQHTYLMDGDNIRYGLCADLAFSEQDRNENVRRVGHVASLMIDAGLIVLTAFISPFKHNRAAVRAMFRQGEFIEVFINTPISECERRDPRGLYKKARSGEIKDFTGVSSPYEPPESAEIIIDCAGLSVDGAANQIVGFLEDKGYL